MITSNLTAADKPLAQRSTSTETTITDYLPGVIVVKFADGITAGDQAISSGIVSVDAVIREYGVSQMNRLVKESSIRSEFSRAGGIVSSLDMLVHLPHGSLLMLKIAALSSL